MKNLILVLLFLITGLTFGQTTLNGSLYGSSSASPYAFGPSNPFSYKNLPQVLSNGVSIQFYFNADDLPNQVPGGLTSGASIASGTVWTDEVNGYSITLTSSTAANTYEVGVNGGHSSVRFPGNANGQGIFSSGINFIDQYMTLLTVGTDVFQPNGINSIQASLAYSLGTSNQIRFGEASTITMGQLTVAKNGNPSLANTASQLIMPSYPCLFGWAQATTVTYYYLDEKVQIVNAIFTSTPVTTTGGYIANFNSSGQQMGFDCEAIIGYAGPVTDAAVTVAGGGSIGWRAVVNAIKAGFGIGLARPNLFVGHGDSVIRSYGSNSNGTGNSWSFVNDVQNLLGNQWACYNQAADGAQTTDLINNFAAITTLVNGNNYARRVYYLEIGNNDIVANSTAATIENNILNLCQEAQNAGFTDIVVQTILNGGYSGGQLTVYNAVNTWITGTLPGLGPYQVVNVATNTAITNFFFSAPHLKDQGLKAMATQVVAAILNFVPTSWPTMTGTVTLAGGAASVTMQFPLTTAMKFYMAPIGPSGTAAGWGITVNSGALSILNATGAGTDNGVYKWWRGL